MSTQWLLIKTTKFIVGDQCIRRDKTMIKIGILLKSLTILRILEFSKLLVEDSTLSLFQKITKYTVGEALKVGS